MMRTGYEQVTGKFMEAAEEAQRYGFTPEECFNILQTAWCYVLEDKQKLANYQFDRLRVKP